MHIKKLILLCLVSLILTGCWKEPDVFEKRYVSIEIPGYAETDYIHLLGSPDSELRYLAAANLLRMGVFGSEELAETAQKIENLLKDASPKVRAIAAHTFNKIKTRSPESTLIQLTNDVSPAVRLEALQVLGRRYSESPEAVRAILGRLVDKSILVRLSAIESLAECKKTSSRSEIVMKLLDMLPKISQPEQLKIIETLSRIGKNEEIESVLLEMLDFSKERPIRVTTLKAIGQLKSTSAIQRFPDLIRRAVLNEIDIIEPLSSIGTPEAIQLLITLLDSSDQGVRISAIEEIGKSGCDQGLKELIKKFSEEEQKIIKEVDSVKWANSSSSYPELWALIGAIKDKIVRVKDTPQESLIIQFLRSINKHENMIGLVLLAGEEKPFDRIVIGPSNGHASLLPDLERYAYDPSSLTRILSLQALDNIVNPRALSIIENSIKEPSFGIRYAAIGVLGSYCKNTSNYAPLDKLYEIKENFVPQNYADDDRDFLIRQLIEETISDCENKYRTQQRRVSELEGAFRPTKLIAALWLAKEQDDVALPVLLDFLEKGVVSEERAALNGLEQFSSLSAEVISRLSAIKAKSQDDTLKERIEKIITQATSVHLCPLKNGPSSIK